MEEIKRVTARKIPFDTEALEEANCYLHSAIIADFFSEKPNADRRRKMIKVREANIKAIRYEKN